MPEHAERVRRHYYTACWECHGKGWVYDEGPCGTCDGRGQVTRYAAELYRRRAYEEAYRNRQVLSGPLPPEPEPIPPSSLTLDQIDVVMKTHYAALLNAWATESPSPFHRILRAR